MSSDKDAISNDIKHDREHDTQAAPFDIEGEVRIGHRPHGSNEVGRYSSKLGFDRTYLEVIEQISLFCKILTKVTHYSSVRYCFMHIEI